MAARGLARHVVMRSAYFLAALAVVSATELLMVVPRRLAQRHAHNFDLAIFDVPLSLPSFAVYSVSHERFASSPMHRLLYRLATDALIESAIASRTAGLRTLVQGDDLKM
jgi:DNA-binding transcriptional LysR family regulator